MRICFPIENSAGLDSLVFGHFGSAPAFVIVDTDVRQAGEIDNLDLCHIPDQCAPLTSIKGIGVNVVVVAGIGQRAFTILEAEGIEVYRAERATVRENVKLIKSGGLRKWVRADAHADYQGICLFADEDRPPRRSKCRE